MSTIGNILSGTVPGSGAVTNVANQLQGTGGSLVGQGESLQGYLQSGTLPAPLQAEVTQNVNAQKAAIKQKYGNLGIGNSTLETTAENQATNQGIIDVGTLGTMLAQLGSGDISSGINALGGAESGFTDIMNQEVAQDTALTNAIGNFAGALGKSFIPGAGSSSPVRGGGSTFFSPF